MAINHPQGASWFTPMTDIHPPFEDLVEQDERQRARNEPDYAPDDEPFIREEWFKKVPMDEWTIAHEANAPFFSMRAVPSFDIEIRFKTRAVKHVMTPKEARAFANALLAAVRNVERESREYEQSHPTPEQLAQDIKRRTLG